MGSWQNDGEAYDLSTLIQAGEYITISGLLLNNDYVFTCNRLGTPNPDYITVTDTSINNIFIAAGSPSATVNNIQVTTVRIHVNLDGPNNCTTDTDAHKLTIQNLSAANCNQPTIESFTYKSDMRLDFAWTAPLLTTPDSYDWEIVADGAGQGNMPIAFGNTSELMASSGDTLEAGEVYDLYLRSNCQGSANGTSSYIGPFSFTTNTSPLPTNDFCEDAVFLLQETDKETSGDATAVSGTLVGGAGSNIPFETCVVPGNARDDVWYSFIAQTSEVSITVENLSFDAVISLFSGSCNSLGDEGCEDSAITSPANEQLNATSMSIGDTYFVRVYYQGFNTPLNATFDIKIWSDKTIIDSDMDKYSDVVDCAPNDEDIYPGAPETPDNGVDEDCDGSDLKTWYLDFDEDNYGDTNNSTLANTQPTGYITDNTDCDDSNSAINPGATEVCNGEDDDCNGDIDDDDVGIDLGTQSTWYEDTDGDGFGDPNVSVLACNQPTNYVNNSSDNCPSDVTKTEPGDCGCGVADTDSDGDGTPDCNDTCPGSDDAADADLDNVPDGCDVCDGDDATGDSDNDGVCDDLDICPASDDSVDSDGDGVPNGCDTCPLDNPDDSDGDGVCDSNDICPGSDDTADADSDNVPDGCDVCDGDDATGDSDNDGVCDNLDICPGFDDTIDTDGDNIPDGCDTLNIEEFDLQDMRVYPNPFHSSVLIEIPQLFDTEKIDINLFDI
ncbi:MAG: putative metal-binding motif-containing protein, partial [Gammaproteobacteria bacterium]|nr:putative metal-binding motif-containing protein [Gammaproteobacteria bacterium]